MNTHGTKINEIVFETTNEQIQSEEQKAQKISIIDAVWTRESAVLIICTTDAIRRLTVTWSNKSFSNRFLCFEHPTELNTRIKSPQSTNMYYDVWRMYYVYAFTSYFTNRFLYYLSLFILISLVLYALLSLFLVFPLTSVAFNESLLSLSFIISMNAVLLRFKGLSASNNRLWARNKMFSYEKKKKMHFKHYIDNV